MTFLPVAMFFIQNDPDKSQTKEMTAHEILLWERSSIVSSSEFNLNICKSVSKGIAI